MRHVRNRFRGVGDLGWTAEDEAEWKRLEYLARQKQGQKDEHDMDEAKEERDDG